MAKIAVYQKYYKAEDCPPEWDIVSRALEGLGHDVISDTPDMRDAVREVMRFADLARAEQPDLVLMGAKLNDEGHYLRNPETDVKACTVRRRAWGSVKEEPGRLITFLLPQFDKDNETYHFPHLTTMGNVSDDPPNKVLDPWKSKSYVSAAILSRVVETYLPEAKRIGISTGPLLGSMLHAEVRSDLPDAALKLSQHIQQLTGEAPSS